MTRDGKRQREREKRIRVKRDAELYLPNGTLSFTGQGGLNLSSYVELRKV